VFVVADLCKCIRNLKYLINFISAAEARAREGDLKHASLLATDALSELRDLESCLGVSLDETRRHLEEAFDKLFHEEKAEAGIGKLIRAQWSLFREIENKVCK